MIVSTLTHEPAPVNHQLLLDRAGELLVDPTEADILMACCGTRAALEGFVRQVLDEKFGTRMRSDTLGDHLSALKCRGVVTQDERRGASRATKVLTAASHNRAVSFGPAMKAHASVVELCALVANRIDQWPVRSGGWGLD